MKAPKLKFGQDSEASGKSCWQQLTIGMSVKNILIFLFPLFLTLLKHHIKVPHLNSFVCYLRIIHKRQQKKQAGEKEEEAQ